MGNLFKMEWRRSLRSTLLWSLTLTGLVALGMMFYPMIAENMHAFEGILNSPMMKTLLKAISTDVSALTALEGYFSTYAGIYLLLIGSVFAVTSAVQLLAGEQRDGTLEFLRTRPVNRGMIYIQKNSVLLIQIVIVNLCVLLGAFAAFQVLTPQASVRYVEKEAPLTALKQAVRTHPSKLDQVFTWNDDLLMGWVAATVEGQLPDAQDQLTDMGMDDKELQDLMEQMLEDPEGLLQDVLNNPQAWMDRFQIPEDQKENFLSEVEATRTEFENLKTSFYEDPAFRGELFSQTPQVFLGQLTSHGDKGKLAGAYPQVEEEINQLLITYDPVVLVHMILFGILLMWTFAAIAMAISQYSKNTRGHNSLVMGVVMGLYFVDTISQVSPQLTWLGRLSPFHYVDWGAIQARGSGRISDALVLLAIALVFHGLAYYRFVNKDIPS